MMKYLILFIVLLFGLSACHTPVDSDNDKFIVGKWVLYKTIVFQNNDDSAAVLCNVCPEITFVKNHGGFIKKPGKILLYFKWAFDENKLTIKQTDLKATDHILNDGDYKIIYDRQFQEAILFDSLKSTRFILRR